MPSIQERQVQVICPEDHYYSNGRCYPDSDWYWWGRWVLAGCVVLFVVALFFIFTCISARRRRKRGMHPMYGTGWMAPAGKFGPNGGNQQQGWGGGGYGQQNYQAPPPQYGQYGQSGVNPQYTGTTFQQADGYYGGHHEGVQLQSPPNTYQNVYSPPAGPPPGK